MNKNYYQYIKKMNNKKILMFFILFMININLLYAMKHNPIIYCIIQTIILFRIFLNISDLKDKID